MEVPIPPPAAAGAPPPLHSPHPRLLLRLPPPPAAAGWAARGEAPQPGGLPLHDLLALGGVRLRAEAPPPGATSLRLSTSPREEGGIGRLRVGSVVAEAAGGAQPWRNLLSRRSTDTRE